MNVIINGQTLPEYQSSREKHKQEMNEKAKLEKKAFLAQLKTGTILHSSWGYDQTQCDYYKVIRVRGCTVDIVEIGNIIEEGSEGRDCCRAMPDITKEGKASSHRVGKWGDIKICSSSTAKLWDGTSKYWSWYA